MIRYLVGVILLLVVSSECVAQKGIKCPLDADFAAISESEKNDIQSWLSELDALHKLHSETLLVASGEFMGGVRGEPDFHSTTFRFAHARNSKNFERQWMIAQRDGTTKVESIAIGGNEVLGQVIDSPSIDVDYLQSPNKKLLKVGSGQFDKTLEVQSNESLNDMYFHGFIDPLCDIFYSARPVGPMPKLPSDLLAKDKWIDIAEKDGITFARWLKPEAGPAPVFYRLTVGFKDEVPVFVGDERCSKRRSDGVIGRMYVCGSVEIDWKQVDAETKVPIRIVRRNNMAPEQKAWKIHEFESDTKIRWFFGSKVPKSIFEEANIGKLNLTEFFP